MSNIFMLTTLVLGLGLLWAEADERH
jgi:hypothetical protein